MALDKILNLLTTPLFTGHVKKTGKCSSTKEIIDHRGSRLFLFEFSFQEQRVVDYLLLAEDTA
jgi:hypothetical protein